MNFINKKKPTCVIAFMGVDGSGKSTIIDKLSRSLSGKYAKIRYLHLRPYLFLTDKRIVVKNPHNIIKTPSKIASLFKILSWLIIYRLFFLTNLKKKNQLIVFDRYAHDLTIDPIRYNFNLPKKITRYILNLFPEPDLWIILTAAVTKIEQRKKELSSKELKRQMKLYINFSRTKKNSFIINTNKTISKNLKLIIKRITIN